jgi:DNA-binding transcriptional ArsR family regulator
LLNPEVSTRPYPGRLVAPPPPLKVSDETLRHLCSLLQLLAEPTRLKILLTLGRQGEQHVSALCIRLGQSQPGVSNHLKRLRDSGLLTRRRQGKNNFYSITSGFLAELLQPLFTDSGTCRQVQLGDLVLGLRGS